MLDEHESSPESPLDEALRLLRAHSEAEEQRIHERTERVVQTVLRYRQAALASAAGALLRASGLTPTVSRGADPETCALEILQALEQLPEIGKLLARPAAPEPLSPDALRPVELTLVPLADRPAEDPPPAPVTRAAGPPPQEPEPLRPVVATAPAAKNSAPLRWSPFHHEMMAPPIQPMALPALLQQLNGRPLVILSKFPPRKVLEVLRADLDGAGRERLEMEWIQIDPNCRGLPGLREKVLQRTVGGILIVIAGLSHKHTIPIKNACNDHGTLLAYTDHNSVTSLRAGLVKLNENAENLLGTRVEK